MKTLIHYANAITIDAADNQSPLRPCADGNFFITTAVSIEVVLIFEVEGGHLQLSRVHLCTTGAIYTIAFSKKNNVIERLISQH